MSKAEGASKAVSKGEDALWLCQLRCTGEWLCQLGCVMAQESGGRRWEYKFYMRTEWLWQKEPD